MPTKLEVLNRELDARTKATEAKRIFVDSCRDSIAEIDKLLHTAQDKITLVEVDELLDKALVLLGGGTD